MPQPVRIMIRFICTILLTLGLWSCGETGNDLPPPGGTTAGTTGGAVAGGGAGGAGGSAGDATMTMMPVGGTPFAGRVMTGGSPIAGQAGMAVQAGAVAGAMAGGGQIASGGDTAGTMAGGQSSGGSAGAIVGGMATVGGLMAGQIAGGMPQMGGQGGAMMPLGGQPDGMPRCGDGIVNGLEEQCDDGNAVDNDRCRNDCTVSGKEIVFEFPDANLIQVLSADARFSTLLRIIQVAGVELTSDLVDETRTLFAPTDAGFDEFFGGNNADELIRLQSQRNAALEFVRRHLIRGDRESAYLATARRLRSVSGRFLSVAANGEGAIRIEGIDVPNKGDRASNGRIYPIEGIFELLPPVDTPTCENPQAIDAPMTVFGSLVSVPRAVYRVSIPETGQYCIDTRGSAFDTVIQAELNCSIPSGNPDRANDTPTLTHTIDGERVQRSHPEVFRDARLLMDFREGDTIDVIVNGARFPWGGNDAGDFVLSVQPGPCAPYTTYDYLDETGEFSLYLSLIDAFQLTDRLKSVDSLTVFAPTNGAFENFESEAAGELALRAQNGGEMWSLLAYHLASPARLQAGLSNQGTISSIQGLPLEAVLRVNQTFVNGAQISRPDRLVENGVVHGLNGLLAPPDACEQGDCAEELVCVDGWCLPKPPPGTVMDELRSSPEYSIFVSLVDYVDQEIEAGVARLLSDTGNFAPAITAFVPSDEVFDNLDLNALRLDPEALARTLMYHVSLGAFDSNELLLRASVPTAIDSDLPVTQGQAGLRVGNVSIAQADRIASNGYIHKLAGLIEAPEALNACNEAIAIEEPGEYVGTTWEAGSIYAGSCVVADGPEQVYRFRPAEDGRYCIHTLNSPNVAGNDQPLDTVLYVREEDCSDELAAVQGMCNDNCDDGSGGGCGDLGAESNLSSLTAELEGNTDYFIFVDTYVQDPTQPPPRGNFSLSITAGAGCGEQPPVKTIRELIAERPELSQFNQLISVLDGENAGLVGGNPWPGAGPYTVFVPSNEAINRYEAAEWANLMADRNRLRAVVEYHQLSRRAPARILDGSSAFVTVEGTPLLSDSRGGQTLVGGAVIEQADIQASNGIIHVIDTLLLPPDRCMADVDCGGEDICVDAGVCAPIPPLYTCENPFVIPSEPTGDVLFTGNTEDRVSAESARCAQGAEGPDHVYTLTGEGRFAGLDDQPVDVCLSTIGSDFDTALHVRQGGCQGPEIECEDDVDVLFGDVPRLQVEAELTLRVSAGETYFIFVDSSEQVLSGEYQLLVLPGACEQN